MSKKVAVTGGAGRLGKYICDEFLASGWSVLSIDVVPSGGTATANANAAGALTTLMADLTDPGQAYAALAGCDAVVHMAAWANAGVVTDPRTFNDNTSALFNILQAAADLGIKRIISASSNQLYGFAGAPPLFVPVDEAHPARPVNSYALSKLVGEQTAEYFSRTRGLEVLSFRIMGTRAPEELPAETAAMGGDPAGEAWLLWTRTDARDVATACRQAVEVDSVESGVYNITGPRVAIDTPTMELIAAHFGEQTEVRSTVAGFDSPLSCEKARRAFGYEPKHAWAEGVDTLATVEVQANAVAATARL